MLKWLFGFDLIEQHIEQREAALNAARQGAEYEKQCELFRRNQEVQGTVIEGECRRVEDDNQKLLGE